MYEKSSRVKNSTWKGVKKTLSLLLTVAMVFGVVPTPWTDAKVVKAATTTRYLYKVDSTVTATDNDTEPSKVAEEGTILKWTYDDGEGKTLTLDTVSATGGSEGTVASIPEDYKDGAGTPAYPWADNAGNILAVEVKSADAVTSADNIKAALTALTKLQKVTKAADANATINLPEVTDKAWVTGSEAQYTIVEAISGAAAAEANLAFLLTGMAASKNTVALAPAGTETVTMTFSDAGSTTGDIVLDETISAASSDEDVATATVGEGENKNKVTITGGNKLGTATITVSSTKTGTKITPVEITVTVATEGDILGSVEKADYAADAKILHWALDKDGKLTLSAVENTGGQALNGTAYEIKAYGSDNMPWAGYASQIKTAEIDASIGDSTLESMAGLFAGLSELTAVTVGANSTKDITDMTNMFKGCSKLAAIDLANLLGKDVAAEKLYDLSECAALAEVKVPGTFGKSIAIPNAADNRIWAASDNSVEAKVTKAKSTTKTVVDDTVKGKTVKLKYLPEIAIDVTGTKATLSTDKTEVSLKQNDTDGAAVVASLADTIKVGEDTIASDDIYKPEANADGYTYAVTTKNGEEEYNSITVVPDTDVATNGQFAVKPGAKANLEGETVTVSYKKGDTVLATYDLKAIVEKDATFNVIIDFYNEAEDGKKYSSDPIEIAYAESGSKEIDLDADAIGQFVDKENKKLSDAGGLYFAYKVTGLENEKTGAFYPIDAGNKVSVPKDILDVNGEVHLTLAVAIKDYTIQYMASDSATTPLKTVRVTVAESNITVDGDSLLVGSLPKGKTVTSWKAAKGSNELEFTPGTKFSEKIDNDKTKIENVDKVVDNGVIKLVPTLGDYKYKIHFLDAETGKITIAADEEFVYSESSTHTITTEIPTMGDAVDGYTVEGWYATKEIAEGTEKITAIPAKTGEDVTVYAKRTPNKITVKYDTNKAGASKATDAEKAALDAISIKNEELAAGGKVDAGAALTEKAPKGYKFVGWKQDEIDTIYTSATGLTGAQIKALDAEKADGKVTLKAQWAPIEYTITYNYGTTLYPEEYSVAEGKEGASTYTIETNSVGFKLQEPTLRGYTLTNWVLNDEAKTVATLAELQKLCQNVTLYGVFAEEELTLTIVANQPEDSPYDIEVEGSKETTIKVKANQENPFKRIDDCGYSLKGYEFVGWTTGDGEYVRYANDFEAPLNGDEIATLKTAGNEIYALWEPMRLDVIYSKDTNTVAENLKAGVKNINRTFFYANSCGTKIELKNPTRGGYKFKKWVDCSENVEGGKASILISSNDKTYISRDKLVDLIDQDGYPCIGAEWEKVGTVIKFNANVPEGTKITSGNVPADITVASNNTRAVTLTKNAAKINNYKFLGWSSSPYSSTMSYKDGAKIDDNLCSDFSGFNDAGDQVVNLYAVWQPISYSITYKNAELGKQGVTKNDNVTTFKGYVTDGRIELTKPERPGFTFTGWYSKSSCKPADELSKKDANTWYLNVGSVTTVYKKQTVYAGWVGKSVTITFDSGVNKIQRNVTIKDSYNKKNTQVLKYNGKPIALTASKYKVTSPTNFTFAGWSLEAPVKYEFADGTREIDFADKEKVDGEFIEQFDGNSITLYGVWEPKPFKITVYEKFGSAAAKKNTFYYNDLKFNAFDTAITSDGKKIYVYNENNDFYDVEFAGYDGYYIDGIYTKAGCTVKDVLSYIDTSIKKNQKALSIYIKYAPIEYTIKYTTTGMTGTITGSVIDQKNPFGKNVMLRKNQFKKTGKKFLGWSTQKDQTGFEKVEFKANRLIKFDDLLYTAKNNLQDIDVEKKTGGKYDITLYPVFSE